MYFKFETQTLDGNQVTHIIKYFDDGSFMSFQDMEWNQGVERIEYLAWVEEGNVAEEWNPEAN